jgi:hypothetical protein
MPASCPLMAKQGSRVRIIVSALEEITSEDPFSLGPRELASGSARDGVNVGLVQIR